MTSATTSSRSNSSHRGRLSPQTYRHMGRSSPENSAEHPEFGPKLNVLTTLRLKSNENSSLQDPLPPMSLPIRTLPEFIFLDDMHPYGCASAGAHIPMQPDPRTWVPQDCLSLRRVPRGWAPGRLGNSRAGPGPEFRSEFFHA